MNDIEVIETEDEGPTSLCNSAAVHRLVELMVRLDAAVVAARRERDAFPFGSDEYVKAMNAGISRLHEFYGDLTNSAEYAVLSRDANA